MDKRVGVEADPLLTAIDEERRRLAKELHDGLGQALTGVLLMSSAAGTEPTAVSNQFTALASEAAARTRGLIQCLDPGAHSSELQAVLRAVTKDMQERLQQTVRLTADEIPALTLSATVVHHLHHALVDTLAWVINAGERAPAQVTVEAKTVADIIEVKVQREPSAAPTQNAPQHSQASSLLRRRMAQIGGHLSVDASGCVRLQWPL